MNDIIETDRRWNSPIRNASVRHGDMIKTHGPEAAEAAEDDRIKTELKSRRMARDFMAEARLRRLMTEQLIEEAKWLSNKWSADRTAPLPDGPWRLRLPGGNSAVIQTD